MSMRYWVMIKEEKSNEIKSSHQIGGNGDNFLSFNNFAGLRKGRGSSGEFSVQLSGEDLLELLKIVDKESANSVDGEKLTEKTPYSINISRLVSQPSNTKKVHNSLHNLVARPYYFCMSLNLFEWLSGNPYVEVLKIKNEYVFTVKSGYVVEFERS